MRSSYPYREPKKLKAAAKRGIHEKLRKGQALRQAVNDWAAGEPSPERVGDVHFTSELLYLAETVMARRDRTGCLWRRAESNYPNHSQATALMRLLPGDHYYRAQGVRPEIVTLPDPSGKQYAANIRWFKKGVNEAYNAAITQVTRLMLLRGTRDNFVLQGIRIAEGLLEQYCTSYGQPLPDVIAPPKLADKLRLARAKARLL